MALVGKQEGYPRKAGILPALHYSIIYLAVKREINRNCGLHKTHFRI